MSRKPMSLKQLAQHLGLSPATVSLVINRSTVADSIPQETKDRIFAAAGKFKYRANFLARTLRSQRSFTIGVIVPEGIEEGAQLREVFFCPFNSRDHSTKEPLGHRLQAPSPFIPLAQSHENTKFVRLVTWDRNRLTRT